MAKYLQRGFSYTPSLRSALLSASRSFSADALIELKPGEIGIVSGIPEEHLRRKLQPNKVLEKLDGGKSIFYQHRRDPYANVGDAGLGFYSEEAAKAFAERHGWEYVLKKHQTPLLKVRAYADNFKWKGPPSAEED